MALMNVFDIAGSGMSAQSVRLNTTASNIANAESVATNGEDTYRARQPVFEAQMHSAMRGNPLDFGSENLNAGQGVRVMGVVESDAPYQLRYEPGHPYADENGYVKYPNVNVVEEMTNMISASRSFQTNADVMSAAKKMMEQALALGQ